MIILTSRVDRNCPANLPASARWSRTKRDEAKMATKEQESPEFYFENLPELCGIEKLRLETTAHPNGDIFRIVGFEWNNKKYWYMPRVITQDLFDCGLVYLYVKRGSRIYTSRLLFTPSENRIRIKPPEFRKTPKGRALILHQLSECQCVDIDFLRAEDKRLWARSYTYKKSDLHKIKRPPRGHIV
jgi:hypothetical protein